MALERYPFAVSVQGAGHLRREQDEENVARGRKFPCQDSSFAAFCPADDVHRTPYYIGCVCDGHGGAAYFRSGAGSQFAVEALCSCVSRSVDGIAPLIPAGGEAAESALKSLAADIVGRWCALVDEDITAHPVTEQELALLAEEDAGAAARYREGNGLRAIYGSTALACVVADAAWFAVQVGDGDLVLHTEGGGFSKPVPADGRLFLNQTTSLCDTDAASEFRVAFGTELPDAAFCSTDGVANSFAGNSQLFEFYTRVLWLFRDWDGEEKDGASGDVRERFEAACRELEKSLPDISRRGSGDDVSLAGFVGIDALKVREHLRYRSFIQKGREAYSAGKKEDAAKDFKAAAEHGYPEGWHLLGGLCEEAGLRDEARAMYEKAAAQGVAQAREPLGRLLYDGGCARQKDGAQAEAFALFERAAQYGNRDAQYAVSLYYGRPQDYPSCGVRQNFMRAIDWTLKAARQGHPDAECKLGKCYRDGRGVQKDAELSRRWYEKAAEHGSEEAKAQLARLTDTHFTN